MIHFNCTNVKDYEVDEAVLNLHLHEIDNSSDFGLDENFSINLNVSRVVKNRQGILTKALFTNNWIKLSRKKLKAGAWLKVDVTHMVVETFKHHNELAIVVKVQDSMNRTNLVVSHQGSESSLSLTPYIQLTLKDNAHKRTRRTVGMDCTENSREVRCCRYPLEVNFEAFGWDWIIAPKVYEANYCSGECPYSFLQKYPHTHLVHLAAPEGSGGPCCTPRRMSSISMLYFDHDFNIIYGTIPGMVVESCGCS